MSSLKELNDVAGTSFERWDDVANALAAGSTLQAERDSLADRLEASEAEVAKLKAKAKAAAPAPEPPTWQDDAHVTQGELRHAIEACAGPVSDLGFNTFIAESEVEMVRVPPWDPNLSRNANFRLFRGQGMTGAQATELAATYLEADAE